MTEDQWVEFAKLVKHMRSLQRRFFDGEKSVVAQAKRAERQVDEALDAIPGVGDRPRLFE